MGLNSTIYGNIRAGSPEAYGTGTGEYDVTQRGALPMCQDIPPKSELVRQGQSWMVCIDTSDAFTYVAAWPTTRAELVLYNGDPVKSYIIDSAWMVDVSSAAAAQAKALLGQMGQPAIAAPTNNASLLVSSRSGRSYTGNLKVAIANTAFALANRWEMLAPSTEGVAASIGSGVYTDLYGGWIIPPGRAFCLAGVAATAAGTAIIGVVWHEVLLPVVS